MGELDELNARTGVINSSIHQLIDSKMPERYEYLVLCSDVILSIQNTIFEINAEIGNPKLDSSEFKDFSAHTKNLEEEMDKMDEELEELRNFIVPGGSIAASYAHLCRTQARKCERIFTKLEITNYKLQINNSISQYLNRLSDYFFVLARYLNKKSGGEEVVQRSLVF